MLRNDRQLRIAVEKLADVEAARDASEGLDRETWERLALKLKCEIADYILIKSGQVDKFEVNGLDRLGEAVVKARLAKGWTQKNLADELGVVEQQVQRDERHDYESAGLARVADVIDALGWEFRGHLVPAMKNQQIFDGTAVAFAPSVTTTKFQRVSPAATQQTQRVQTGVIT